MTLICRKLGPAVSCTIFRSGMFFQTTFELLKPLTGYNGTVKHAPERGGDIKHSLADITLAQQHLGYKPLVTFEEGLRRTVDWYRSETKND